MNDSPSPAAAGEPAAAESVIAVAPVTVRRIARWAECDPAGVVYFGNYPGYLLSAAWYFRRHLFGSQWTGQSNKGGYQTPGKAIAQVFKSSLWPNDVFDMQVFAGDVRKHTYDTLVHARRADNGKDVFFGRITSIVVEMQDRTRTAMIPEHVVAALTDYRRQNPAPAFLLDEGTWQPSRNHD